MVLVESSIFWQVEGLVNKWQRPANHEGSAQESKIMILLDCG